MIARNLALLSAKAAGEANVRADILTERHEPVPSLDELASEVLREAMLPDLDPVIQAIGRNSWGAR